MSINQQTELKLIEVYDQELKDFVGKGGGAARSGKESHQRFLKELQRKVDVYEKQVLNYKRLFPQDTSIQFYEARVCFFQGAFKVNFGMYYELYPSMFSPSLSGELHKALALFDKSLQLSEQFNARSMKVFCYRQLNDKKRALQELDYIIENYAHDEEAYLQARKEKDEMETSTSSGIGRLFRSIFGQD